MAFLAGLGAANWVGLGLTAAQTIGHGIQADRQADYNEKRLKIERNNELASAQREAAIHRKRAQLAQSRTMAVAERADKTVLDVMGGLETQGEYAALSALFSGESRAQGLDEAATMSRYRANKAKSSAVGKTLMATTQTLFDKYG